MSCETVSVKCKETGEVIVPRCRVATRFVHRLAGLLGRKSLARTEGLLLHPCNAVHTFFMRFSIDCIFLDKSDRIIKTVEAIRPWRMACCGRASKVLETAEGVVAQTNLVPGNNLEY